MYTRHGCHLCEDAKAVLDRVAADVEFSLAVHDIDQDAELQRRYSWDIPVLLVDGVELFKHHFDEARLRAKLSAIKPK